jgi:hypothetical protein
MNPNRGHWAAAESLAGLSPEAFCIRFQHVGSTVRGTQTKGGVP